LELIRGIDSNRFKQDLVRSLYEFCNDSNVNVIAEGIETEDELRTLINIGIHYGQCYLIQRPDENIKEIDRNIIKLIDDVNNVRKQLEDMKTDSFCIGLLARIDKPIEIGTSIEDTNDIFSLNYTLQGIAVTKYNKPVGLVMRHKFYYQLMRRKIENVETKPIEPVMTKLPLIVDYCTPLRKVIKLAMARREEAVYDYVIVVKDGIYYGVVPISRIIEALS